MFGNMLMYKCHRVRVVPIDRRLVVASMLADKEAWLDAYHARAREVIGPELGPADRAWLEAATAPIGR